MLNKNLLPLLSFVVIVAALTLNLQAAPDSALNRHKRVTEKVKVVSQVMSSVVNLNTERILDSQKKDDREGTYISQSWGYSLGSGSIISGNGLILTNAHVVDRAIRINANINEKIRADAQLVAIDRVNDLALLKVNLPEAITLTPIKMGEVGDLLLGEDVIALGNPYGLGSSISHGILSAVGRQVSVDNKILFTDVLQTDAPVFPGSSGGPLINMNGEMIGITSSIFGDEQRIGFAIPLQRAQNVMARWLIPERFSPVSLGIIPAVKRLANGDMIFYINDILIDSPAQAAGLKNGDVIVAVNDRPVGDLLDLSLKLCEMRSGQTLRLTLNNERKVNLKVKSINIDNWRSDGKKRFGFSTQFMTENIAKNLNYPFYNMIIISDLDVNSPPDIKRGDILLQIGDIAINGIDDFSLATRIYQPGDEVQLTLLEITTDKDDKKIYIKKETNLKL